MSVELGQQHRIRTRRDAEGRINRGRVGYVHGGGEATEAVLYSSRCSDGRHRVEEDPVCNWLYEPCLRAGTLDRGVKQQGSTARRVPRQQADSLRPG